VREDNQHRERVRVDRGGRREDVEPPPKVPFGADHPHKAVRGDHAQQNRECVHARFACIVEQERIHCQQDRRDHRSAVVEQPARDRKERRDRAHCAGRRQAPKRDYRVAPEVQPTMRNEQIQAARVSLRMRQRTRQIIEAVPANRPCRSLIQVKAWNAQPPRHRNRHERHRQRHHRNIATLPAGPTTQRGRPTVPLNQR
jgi:hypothetical protein